MRQLFLDTSQRAVVSETVPPTPGPNDVLVALRASAISPGTETAGYNAGSAIARGVRSPALMKRVAQMALDQGLSQTVASIAAQTKRLMPRGYSAAGVVVSIGRTVRGFSTGDRVAVMGAPHAELVAVSHQLVRRIPDGVSFEEAAFGALACIALHGVRLAAPTLGESVVVAGLGVVGTLAVQFASAAGASVIGIDPSAERTDRARSLGAAHTSTELTPEQLIQFVMGATGRRGADVALLCAATRDRAAVNAYLQCCRDRGRVVIVGDVALDLDRGPLFGKELSVQVSRSYGPGRYDPEYEEFGVDYPLGFVRWTEGRNLEYFLQAVSEKRIDVAGMITDRVSLDAAPTMYDAIAEGVSSKLGIVISYDGRVPPPRVKSAEAVGARTGAARPRVAVSERVQIGVIGAGAFARANLLPWLERYNAKIVAVANRSAGAFPELRSLYSPALLTTDPAELLAVTGLDAVIVATRHESHAQLAIGAIRRGLAVHVEKPLALDLADAYEVSRVVAESDGLLSIGFNRRYAPLIDDLRSRLITTSGPKQFLYRINAPMPPAKHWTLDARIGGGRLVGEGCHFIDLIRYLSGSECERSTLEHMPPTSGTAPIWDSWTMTLRFRNGDIGTIVYAAAGSATLPKERLEVFADGWVGVLDDFKALTFYGTRGSRVLKRADKGFGAEVAAFVSAVRGTPALRTSVADGVAVAEIIDTAGYVNGFGRGGESVG